MSEQTEFQKRRRRFLWQAGLLGIAAALPSCIHGRTGQFHSAEIEQRNKEYNELEKRREKLMVQLTKLDSAIGTEGLEGIFQQEYDKGPHNPQLRVRSAPATAQLPYDYIAARLELSNSNPLIMLYPGAGSDIVPVLFGHMFHKTAPQIPVRMIYTEISTDYSDHFKQQLEFLQGTRVLSFSHKTKKTDGLIQVVFDIMTGTGRFQVEYRIRPPSDEYYTKEDVAEANFVRENYTFNGTNNIGFVAELTVVACTDNRPVIVAFPDYDYVGEYYAGKKGQGFNYDTKQLVFPDRSITKKELEKLEEEIGPRERVRIIVDNNPYSKERPVKNLPGDFLLSRGYTACSCDGCMEELFNTFPYEKQRYDYTVLYSTPRAGCLSRNELFSRLFDVFDRQIHVYRCMPTTEPNNLK